MVHIEPGTYRITNVAGGTAIAVPDSNVWDIVCWGKNNSKNQQWFAQRSGDGYRFKNCRHGGYLAISETRMNAPLYSAWYPTTWKLIQNSDDHNMYIMKCGDVNLVIDLDNYGAGNNGNHLHVWPQDHWVPQKRWRFERLSDDTGDEEYRLKKEVAEKNEQLAEKVRQLASKDKDITSKGQQLAEKAQVEAELTARLAKKDQELARIQQELSEKSALLEQTQNALHQAEASLKSRDLEPEIESSSLKDELSQQQKETANLREKMERFERLFSQMMGSGVKRPNNMT